MRKKELKCLLFHNISLILQNMEGTINCYICRMLKQLILFLTGLLCWVQAEAQESLLNKPDLLEKVEICLQHTYNFSFQEARSIQLEISTVLPDHPASLFLEALIIYWENFPLTPSKRASDQFVDLMDQTSDLAKEYIKNDQTYIDGVFFDLFGRAFKAMFWADNEKTMKVIPDLGTMYRHVKEGFELKEQFVEFYFSTGLYNYYIEAYPTAHPGYKPLVSFMHKGDRALGLEQLQYATDHTIFLKVESLLFMSLIQLNYENDINSAALYAERLLQEYPRNILFQGHMTNILLHQYEFDKVRKLLSMVMSQDDDYSKMIYTLADAFMSEDEPGQENISATGYLETIEMAETIGPVADIYQAMGYMGLSRLYEKRGLESDSESYARKASHYTAYSFILQEK